MKKTVMLLLLFLSVIYADPQEEKVCEKIKETFEQIDFLLDRFDDTRGAITIFGDSGITYYFKNPKTNYRCLDNHKDKWLYLLYKNNQRYQLSNLYRTEKNNYLLPLYLGHLAKKDNQTQKALEYYHQYIDLKKDDIDEEVLQYIKNGGLKPYKSKWAQHLNPGEEMPKEEFKNIFFGIKDKIPFQTTYTKEINIFNINKLFDHDTIDTASYHVGSFSFDKEGLYDISLDTSHARACRVVIDDMLFSEQTHFKKQFTFSKGFHKIEIELLNRDSMYNVKFAMTPHQKRYSDQELKTLLKDENSEIWLVNYQPTYKRTSASGLEFKKETKSPQITLENSHKPVILILQSTTKVNWHLKNTKNIKAVIIGKHSNLTDKITTDTDIKTIYHAQNSFRAKEYKPKNCSCVASGILLCDTLFIQVDEKITKLFGQPVSAYTFTHEERFIIPNVTIDPLELKQLKEKIENDRKMCKETKLDKVFNY